MLYCSFEILSLQISRRITKRYYFCYLTTELPNLAMDFDGKNSKIKHLTKLDQSPHLNNQTQRDKGGKSYKNVWKKVYQYYN